MFQTAVSISKLFSGGVMDIPFEIHIKSTMIGVPLILIAMHYYKNLFYRGDVVFGIYKG